MVSSGEKSVEKTDLGPIIDSQASQGTTANESTAEIPLGPPASPSPSQPLKRAATTPFPSAHNQTPRSTSTSPRPSREASPIRPPLKSGTASTTKMSRSRKNSQDLSPNRVMSTSNISIPTVPSAAAIQRALSVTGTPQLQSPATPDFSTDLSRLQKSNRGYNSNGNPAGPGPLRLKSPPPSITSSRPLLHSPRKTDPLPPLTPNIVVDRATPSSLSSAEAAPEEDESLTRPSGRNPARGVGGSGSLETVRESSLPVAPATGILPSQYSGKAGDPNRPSTIEENPMEEVLSKGDKTVIESGSESGGNKSTGNKNESKDKRKVTTTLATAKPPTVMPRRSYTQLNPRSKMGEGSVKNMTVETETVSSVPQVAVGGGTVERGLPGRIDTASSLRLKPSNETIRPRKERKKAARKAPSINSGTGGSLFNRRYHHHHLYSRTGPPEIISSLSLTSPEFSPVYMPELLRLSFTQLPSTNSPVHIPRTSADFTTTHVNLRISHSSSTLTGFRARTASSKADIFEAKVANAVGQADSSDSDETFVYESNPPEPLSGRPSRYHSRTPSVTSTASQADHYTSRTRQESHHSIAGKKSMKFANNSYHINSHGETGDNTFGSGHGNSGRMTGGNTPHHHHVGRHGRSVAGHTSLFDNNSPFPNASKTLRTVASNTARMSPRPSSPRSPQIVRLSTTISKANTPLIYDLEGEGADDERTPLIGSMRAGRNRNSRRPAVRQAGYDGSIAHGYCKRITGCILLGGLVGFLIAAVIVALIMSSKPLINVHIQDIQNVLASEQEIMLDLHVHAMNPNLVAIQINDLDINLFAKSKHVSTNALWRDSQRSTKSGQGSHIRRESNTPENINHDDPNSTSKSYNTTDGVDEGNDPIKDPESDSQTMLLGRIFDFDSPLIFDASPIRHQSVSSVGEVRLAKPGNGTQEGGSERWEKVIQYPFELIVRGVLRYSLPISSRIRSASIGGSVTVLPSDSTLVARMIESSTVSSQRRRRKPGLGRLQRIRLVV